jgi:NAD(P)-dependent dehydrogenase (short-subunit alcohol dehydrogenase family)
LKVKFMKINTDLDKLFSLKGKTALVTGGGAGLGLTITETLAKSGAKVIIVSRKKTNVLKAKASILASNPQSSIHALTADLGNEIEIAKLVCEVKKITNSIDILVNNSGVSWGAELGKFPYSAWEKVFSVNVSGLFHLTQSLLPLIERNATTESPSKILNIGSVMGSSPYGDGAYSYSASKSAVHHLTQILAKELAQKRITVNALAPGPFASKMTEFAINTDVKLNSVASGVPLGRIGLTDDIAAATLFICGQGGNYITGAIIPIDGGLHISTGPELFDN